MTIVRAVEDIYADFLFDCYIANKHLSDGDWEFYGKEEHHIEIPAREGGTLNPLNSQFLTLYQHWVAGVLQSEIVGKRCFACVPTGVPPPSLERLRKKWNYPEFISDPEKVRRAAERLRQPEIINKRRESRKKTYQTPEGQLFRKQLAEMATKPLQVTFTNGRVGYYPSRLFATIALGVSWSTLCRWLNGYKIPAKRGIVEVMCLKHP